MKTFNYTFQLSRTEIFEIDYHFVGGNKKPYFSTSAAVFNRPKSDFNQCGQCQETVLKSYKEARLFFEKWDNKHTQYLTEKEYIDMIADIEQLKEKYNFCESTKWGVQRELSKQKVK